VGIRPYKLDKIYIKMFHTTAFCVLDFFTPVVEGIGKNVQNGQTEPKQGFSLFWVTRRRTWVRRVAMFVRSKKDSIEMRFFI